MNAKPRQILSDVSVIQDPAFLKYSVLLFSTSTPSPSTTLIREVGVGIKRTFNYVLSISLYEFVERRR